MIQVLPITQARKDLLQLVDQIDQEYSRVDLSKNGRVKVSLVSSEYLDELEETIYSLNHSMDDIKKAKKEIAQKKYITLQQLKKKFSET